MTLKEVMRWRADDKPESTDAVIVVSEDGKIVKRMPYRKWNKKNQGYSDMNEHVYTQTENRGKQIKEPYFDAKRGRYKNVYIRDGTYQVHRLVAIAFIENHLALPQVNHKNGDRGDNRWQNLEWVTNKQNMSHSWAKGIRNLEKMRKLPHSEMPKIMEMRESGISFESIAKRYGMRGESIRHRVKQYENGLRC